MLRDSPVKVQKYVLRQFAQLLPHDVEARRAFVQNGGLQFLQVSPALLLASVSQEVVGAGVSAWRPAADMPVLGKIDLHVYCTTRSDEVISSYR